MAKEITSSSDIIDSRDIIKRLKELEENIEELDDWEKEELEALQSLDNEGRDYFPDWPSGIGLIKDEYFETYAQDFAKDIGAISDDAQWPATCIDWKKAVSQLKQDYTCIDFDGVEYWGR